MSTAFESMTASLTGEAPAAVLKEDPPVSEYPPLSERKKETPTQAKATRQVIWEAINDLFHQDQAVTRDTLKNITGFKYSLIDDHVSRMIENEDLRRLRDGVYVPIPRYDPPRPVYATMTTDGFFILEIGNQVIAMQPREARQAGALLAGQFAQFSNIQSGHDANYLVNVVWEELKKLKHDLGES